MASGSASRLLSLLACVAALAAAGTGTGAVLVHLLDSQEWAIHSKAVQLSIETLDTGMQRARADAQAYLLAPRVDALAAFRAGQRQLQDDTRALAALVADNPSQVARARAVGDAVKALLAGYAAVLEGGAPGGTAGADIALAAQAVTRATDALDRAEADLLADRLDRMRTMGACGLAALASTVGIGLLLLAVVAVITRRRALADVAPRLASLDLDCAAAQGALAERDEDFRTLADTTHAELVEAARRKDEFLATLSHELRNLLSPILVAARLLNSPDLTPAQRDWSSGVILRQGMHLAGLVDKLLDASRITRGRLELTLAPTALRDVVAMAVEAVQPSMDARRHRLQVEVAHDLPPMAADAAHLAQVVTNLLDNACKFTEPGGQVSLRVCRCDGEVIVTVADTGIGLAAGDLATVFDMFAQVPSALARAAGGLGLGLALAKGIVELHGGTIAAFSDGPGRGAVFRIALPLPQPAPPVAEAGPPATAADDGAHRPLRRVLVADDNRDAADSLAALLRLTGHAVATAYDGEQALATAAAFAPEVVVLDIGMPRLNGYEVAERLRAAPRGHLVTLVALTGWGQNADKLRAVAAGFDRHMTKPVDPGALAALIAPRDAAPAAPAAPAAQAAQAAPRGGDP